MAKEKTIKDYEDIINDYKAKLDVCFREEQANKRIMVYQENLINKLLNTIQNKEIEVRNDVEKGDF